MATLAGRLEVEMMMNLARLSQGVTEAKGMVAGMSRDISRSVDQAKSVLASLGVGLSATAFAAFIKNSVDAMDKLNDLAKATSLTVETLAGLRVAARQSGSDLEGTAAAINKLAQNMGANAEKFRALGISAKDPLEAFKQLSDIFRNIEDPQLRAALGAQALGKSWQAAAPLLSEGSAKIQEMVDRGTKLSGVTTEMAKQADELNDKLEELGGTGGITVRLVGPLLPLLNALADSMLKSNDAARDLGSSFSPLLEAGKAIVVTFGEILFVLRAIGETIGRVAAAAVAFANGDFKGAWDLRLTPEIKAEQEARLRAHEEWVQSIMAIGTAAKATKPALDAMDQVSRSMTSAASAQARADAERAKAFVDSGEAAKKALEAERALERARREAWDHEFNDLQRLARELEAAYDAMRKLSKKLDEQIGKDLDKVLGTILEDVGDAVDAGVKLHNDLAQPMLRVWDQLSDAAGAFFSDLVLNGKSAFDNLKSFAKDLLAQMIALFAKRWVLNLAAGGSLLGSAGSALAGGVGGDSLAGAGLNLITGGAGLAGAGSSFIAGWQGATLGAGVAGPTTAGAGGAMGAGSWLAGLGPVGWAAIAVLAIAAVATIFRDKGENWRATLGFGDNAQVYRTQGVFGAEGFQQIAGDDALNRQIQAFMVSTGALDKIIATHLTAEQIATITANLAGPYTTRADGQPAEFAFGKGDENAGQALTLEYLQKKYGTVFDQIDTTFANFIRGYTGRSEDLLKEIDAFVQIMEALSGTGIKGFDVAALRAMQREGETLGATFQRVGEQWSTFNDLFLTDAEKLENTRALISDVFGDLGVAVPASMEAFKDLVHGLDLSTEAGRTMFEALMAIAPAFANVAQAAAAGYASLQQTIARINGTDNPQFAFNTSVASFQAGNAWAAGLSPQQLVQALLTISGPDWAAYEDANQQLISTILGSYAQLQSASSAAASSLSSFASQMDDGFNEYGTKKGMRDWIDQMLLDPSASTLTADERFLEAQKQYEEMRDLAQGGDHEAMAGLTAAAKTYLDLARMMFGSNADYNAIFSQVLGDVGAVGGMTQADVNAKLYTALPTSSTIASSADIGGVGNLLAELIDQVRESSKRAVEAESRNARRLTEEVRQTGRTGVLARTRA